MILITDCSMAIFLFVHSSRVADTHFQNTLTKGEEKQFMRNHQMACSSPGGGGEGGGG